MQDYANAASNVSLKVSWRCFHRCDSVQEKQVKSGWC